MSVNIYDLNVANLKVSTTFLIDVDPVKIGIDAGKYWPNKPVKSDEFWDEATEELGAIYGKHGGYVSDPLLAAENFAMAAKREGVDFKFRKVVVGIEKDNGRVSSVLVSD